MDIKNEADIKFLGEMLDEALGNDAGQGRQYGFALVLIKGKHLEEVTDFSYISSFTTPDAGVIGQALVDRAKQKKVN